MVSSLAAFGRIIGNDFINMDDSLYIIENNHIKSGIHPESLKWAFTNKYATMWMPVTWISLTLNWSIFGANPSGYHMVNLFLHIGAVIFLFLFLFKATHKLWPSAFAVAFFALHPLRVESVAWATEIKDVLSMFFGMACLYVYSCYAEKPNPSRYVICFILFALALMSKSMLISLPLLMLLLDYWPLGRYQLFSTNDRLNTNTKLLLEKVPFFILSILSSMLTIWAQYENTMPHYLTFPLRVINAVVSCTSYLKKTFLPIDLAIYYPFSSSFPLWQISGSVLLLIVITVFAVYYFKKMPFLSVGWFWYLGTLVPVSGLIPVGAPMADHYTYLPSIGIAMMLAWGIPAPIKNKNIRKIILFPTAIVVLFIIMILTWQQCSYWKNSISLFSHALQVTKNNYLAFTNRGDAYHAIGNYQQAVDDYSEAVRIKPDYVGAYNNRGNALLNLGQYQRAIEDYSQAILLKPDYALAYNNRGIVYFVLGDHKQFCRDIQQACHFRECRLLAAAKKEGYCQ